MLNGRAGDQCIEEKSSGSEIDNRRANDASGIETSARVVRRQADRYRCAAKSGACRGIERINIIRFGNSNNHRPIRTALDVKRLRMNVAEIVPLKFKSRTRLAAAARRECGIDVKTVAGRIVVLLRDVDLRIGRQSGSAANSNEKRKFHSARDRRIRAPFYNSTLTVCQGFTAAQWWHKSNGIVIFGGAHAPSRACRSAPSRNRRTSVIGTNDEVRDREGAIANTRARVCSQTFIASCENGALCYVRVQFLTFTCNA